MRAERSVTRIDRGANQSEFVLCPRVRGFSDGCAAGRTRRSALPPSCIGAQTDGLFGWTPSGTEGWADPGLFSAHGDGGLRMDGQRGGHGGPRSRHPVTGPIRTVVFGWMPSGQGRAFEWRARTATMCGRERSPECR